MEALRVEGILKNLGINITILNLRSLSPLDEREIVSLARKFKQIVILDSSHSKFGISAEILSLISEDAERPIGQICFRIGNRFEPTPSAPLLAKSHYPQISTIITQIVNNFVLNVDRTRLEELIKVEEGSNTYFDQPVIGSVGPF
jgi:pyruvate/2-oxoglutarate/acetoin dehydrogenase E1 component